MYSFPHLEPVCFSMSGSNCCFLIWIQISRGRSGGLVLPSLEEFSTPCCDPHSQRILHSQWRSRFFALEFSCFLCDPMGVGNLISGSSAFSKSSLNIWKLLVQVLLSLAWRILSITLPTCEMSSSVWLLKVWTFFVIVFLWDWNENWLFPALWPLLNFPNLLA